MTDVLLKTILQPWPVKGPKPMRVWGKDGMTLRYHARERQHNNVDEKVKGGKMKIQGKIISFSFK